VTRGVRISWSLPARVTQTQEIVSASWERRCEQDSIFLCRFLLLLYVVLIKHESGPVLPFMFSGVRQLGKENFLPSCGFFCYVWFPVHTRSD
jgi:hypothetical protein